MQAAAVKVNARTRVQDGSGRKTRKVELTVNALEQFYHMRQEDAAAILGVSLSSLKSSCRRLGISRWPYSRKRNEEHDTFVSVLLNNGDESFSLSNEQDFQHSQTSSDSSSQEMKDQEDDHEDNIEGLSESGSEHTESAEGAEVVDSKWIRWFIEVGDSDIIDNETPLFP
ncbi:hypothetical protein GUITHDRAFT_105684 [Guillardia theta CCMP2712]|uniref:RWP-RK domain-containing protein n=1 Tax=Guillardia theta (strain CCMP2712) TaxID=905079 RepID=L1JJP2_GUITC|nr:hypothetical protein GUITHDRAFT_105684 [Guillardia theta CCMP2712]EKX48542.1 hypothetical protein GUITHDRAFT_105684 [Guillardia theta CCMP2712]|eukprot:XP_005835522.1 hypothetical protein GUITHDRAFT_105684 [Guillardia theta CCMP2712]